METSLISSATTPKSEQSGRPALRGALVSVVIPAYNEEDYVAGCLQSVLSTNYPNLEIILVDDSSTDDTAKVASQYGTRIVRRASRGGIAAARNDGIDAARGEIIAFVDADCTVEKDWLDMLMAHYVSDDVGGVGGLVKTKKSGIVATYRTFRERETWGDIGKPVEVSDLPGGNSSYRTDVLRKIGGFDPIFAQPRGHEAFEIGSRIIKSGYRLIGEPGAVVWHDREDRLKSWFYSAFGLGYSALSFLRRYKMRGIIAVQLRQVAFITFLILSFAAVLGLAPTPLVIAIAAGLLLFEVARGAYYVACTIAHYGSTKYCVMFPVELALRVLTYVGYTWALIVTISSTLSRPFRRMECPSPSE